MVSMNIRDLLTSFSPSLDYLAISSGDGRIKIWDTLKGQVQTEFADITSSEGNLYAKPERGHLSVDYKCMKWLSLDKKKKRKLGSSLLVLGTGSGDVLALDVSAGQLKWSVSDCHPGGVSAVSFSALDSCIYTSGADGMICKTDPQTGNSLGKFRASTKAISCMSVSSDGKILATAAAQLKIFNCSDHKKLQKFSGHPGAVRSMVFSDDGKYILSSAVGAFENEGVDNGGLYVLAISETGVCYTWCGKKVEELRNSKPTKVLLSYEEFPKKHKGALPSVLAAKLQGTAKPTAANVFIAYGLPVKPLFQKILVHPGTDVKLNSSQDGVLLPLSQSLGNSKKGRAVQNRVTALDRANVEDALLPIQKVYDLHEKMRNRNLVDHDEVMEESVENKDVMVEVDAVTTGMEKQLRQLNILGSKDDGKLSPTLDSATLKGIDLEANIPPKKMRAAVLSMEPSNAYKLLEVLVAMWQSRSYSGKCVLPWIYCILVNHGQYIVAQEKSESQMLNSLLKITKSRAVAVQPLLQLAGRFQLVTAQIDKVALSKNPISLHNDQMDEDEDDDDDDVDEHLYGEEDDGSQLSSDDDS
ncbi:hypothetical protein OIU84_018375 [Salix udensis]|uniref:Small-subunit processome Utp12 domain-containing protein n=1 Tax=Salix udensis TaxID=889485 RepID=A0AAD6PIB7_9ROSI|nr:hypothetical protein OIU84_018375 [Salix udensis]